MNKNIEIRAQWGSSNGLLYYELFNFSGGEVSVKLDVENTSFLNEAFEYNLFAQIQSANDIMALALIKDALLRVKELPVKLFMPYVPYGRQDRVCDQGEAFSLKVFANLINDLNFDEVKVVDPHSDVTGALFNNLKIINQWDVFNSDYLLKQLLGRNDIVLVSPDAGANKKVSKLAQMFNHKHFIRADKLRDVTSGQIKETIVYADDLTGQTCLIVDDIADGGATFLFLAKELKKKNAEQVFLYVTHGIFSKGLEELEDYIDEIWTTNSFKHYGIESLDLNIVNIKGL